MCEHLRRIILKAVPNPELEQRKVCPLFADFGRMLTVFQSEHVPSDHAESYHPLPFQYLSRNAVRYRKAELVCHNLNGGNAYFSIVI